MKLFYCMCLSFVSHVAMAEIPTPRVLRTDTYNGYATIGGDLTSDIDAPIGISISNGGFKYSTLTDSEGKWSIVFRHRAVSYQVEGFNLSGHEKSEVKTLILQVRPDRHGGAQPH